MRITNRRIITQQSIPYSVEYFPFGTKLVQETRETMVKNYLKVLGSLNGLSVRHSENFFVRSTPSDFQMEDTWYTSGVPVSVAFT